MFSNVNSFLLVIDAQILENAHDWDHFEGTPHAWPLMEKIFIYVVLPQFAATDCAGNFTGALEIDMHDLASVTGMPESTHEQVKQAYLMAETPQDYKDVVYAEIDLMARTLLGFEEFIPEISAESFRDERGNAINREFRYFSKIAHPTHGVSSH